MIDVPAVHKQQ